MFPVAVFFGTVVASTETFLLSQFLIASHYLFLRHYWVSVYLFSCTLLMASTITLLKNHLAVPRPEDALIVANGYAFPSAHAAGAVFFSLSTWVYVSKVWDIKHSITLAVVLGALTLLIGYSRIYFGVHTPIQVLAGYSVGLLYGVLFILLAMK